MADFTEVTAQNLRDLRTKRGLNQEDVASILGLQKHNISKLENGTRALSPAEKSLLDLFFFGTIPFEIANEKIIHGVLDFTTDQWRVISILATRNGTTPGKWIADKIRWILAGDEEARREMSGVETERKASHLSVLPEARETEDKVAEGK